MCVWMPPVNGTGHSPSPGQPSPGVVKQDKSSRGSIDTTKTRRVRMSSGERPIGAAKGKQSDTEALCKPPSLTTLETVAHLWPPNIGWQPPRGSAQFEYLPGTSSVGAHLVCVAPVVHARHLRAWSAMHRAFMVGIQVGGKMCLFLQRLSIFQLFDALSTRVYLPYE